jgi:hypothetical protein
MPERHIEDSRPTRPLCEYEWRVGSHIHACWRLAGHRGLHQCFDGVEDTDHVGAFLVRADKA